eukprot:gnl/MRDRNA2_/MRDRNA2_196010_c0_seq1.p1 gnl/MRDRNA2_/MRDRNA2_196010_c0~~gnl/MRDRNA2_/MRDRNA2_196010_c0_seq1.p1  ORF type:complete len:345 (+),score=27.92 gnl/MRDRNA2_/MRDRNA2_196010_c0_seq1:44-1036(+)
MLPSLLCTVLWYSTRAGGGQTVWVHKFPPDYGGSLVRGLPTSAFISDRRMDFLEQNFTHRPKDVWVVTYQKTGTTWMQYTVLQILGYPSPSGGTIEFFQQSPWPETETGPIAMSVENLERSDYAKDGYRVLKSHWPRKDYLVSLPVTSKIIYVMRRVEDVLISYWHHIHNLYFIYRIERGKMSWDQYFTKFIEGDVENGCYFEHVASFWKKRSDPNIQIVRYEDMRHDNAKTVQAIAKFIGVTVSDARRAEILHATSLKEMKKMAQSGVVDTIFKWIGAFRGEHIRSGGTGKKENLVSAAQIAKLVEKYNAVLKPLGVPFEYMFHPTESA